MDKITVRTYRGFEITLYTDTGVFTAWSDYYDKEFAKTSLPAILKGIDVYVKQNEKFKPFKVQEVYQSSSKEPSTLGKIRNIVGMRKDGKFVFLNEKGQKKVLSDYNVRDYALYVPEFSEMNEKLEQSKLKLKAARELHEAEKKAIFVKFGELELVPLVEKKKEFSAIFKH